MRKGHRNGAIPWWIVGPIGLVVVAFIFIVVFANSTGQAKLANKEVQDRAVNLCRPLVGPTFVIKDFRPSDYTDPMGYVLVEETGTRHRFFLRNLSKYYDYLVVGDAITFQLRPDFDHTYDGYGSTGEGNIMGANLIPHRVGG